MNKPIAVLGDLNCNVLKESPESNALSNVLSETNLKQIITTPTRITDTCESLIDVILSHLLTSSTCVALLTHLLVITYPYTWSSS